MTITQAQHTPGPWTLEKRGTMGFDQPSIWAQNDAIPGRAGHMIARIELGNDGNPPTYNIEQMGNARLIAAAPELLEAARALNQALFNDEHRLDAPQAVVDANLALRAAIARAEGR